MDSRNLPDSEMVKGLLALCVLAAAQVCTAYELAVPVYRQPHGFGVSTWIAGGNTAAKGQFPHQAAITMDFRSFCGGGLISKNWILTAGHCVDRFSHWKVVLGAHNIRDSNEPGRLTIISKEAFTHEEYDSYKMINDIAMIRLPEEMQFSETVNVMALPPRSFKNKNFEGKTVRVSGWGLTADPEDDIGINSPTLQFVDLPITHLDKCRDVYGNHIPETQYCASTADKKSTCGDDSGGPVTIGEGANLVNIGVVSYGSSRGCEKGYPVGFTATAHFVDWISNKTGIPIKE